MFTLLFGLFSQLAIAEMTLPDDTGHVVHVRAPAKRIVSLAPHVTELLFAAGAGAQVVGVLEGSDYPPDANRLPRVGSAQGLDLETIVRLRPDLVVGWGSGHSRAQIQKLRALGLPVFLSEPRRLDAISTNLIRLGQLTGTEALAQAAAQRFDTRLAQLKAQHRSRPPLRVFYQIWHAPLMTINDAHILGDVLKVCGAVNVFGTLTPLVPTVSAEAVIAAQPQVIVSSQSPPGAPDWREDWRKVRALPGMAFCSVNPDWMSRQGPRILEGAQALCDCLDAVREDLAHRLATPD